LLIDVIVLLVFRDLGRGAVSFEFELNGQKLELTGCSPNLTLLEYLRQSGRTGSKEGCAEGDCGACSVVIVDRDAQGKSGYRTINSCLVPLPSLANRRVFTVEGLAKAKLHPVQQAMVDHHGSQCGYCTPGFVMSLFEGYYREDLKEQWQLDDLVCGNLCRCTGYRPIRDAAFECYAQRANNEVDPFRAGINEPADELTPFHYVADGETFFRPGSLPELFDLIEQRPDATLVAGATELGLMITKRFKRFSTLISLEGIPELQELQIAPTEIRIGGAVSLTRFWESIGDRFRPFSTMLRWFGSRQIRNRATLGGNLVTASPIGDSAPVLLAHDADVILLSANGERQMPLSEFFISYRKTALRAGEILAKVVIPVPDASLNFAQFYKVSRRREMDISTVSACFRIVLDSVGAVREARIAYGGVAEIPCRAVEIENRLIGKPWSVETVLMLAPLLEAAYSPITDARGSAEYRRSQLSELFAKFFEETQTGEWEQLDHRALPVPEKRANQPEPHESGHKHVAGTAIYTDDSSPDSIMLEVWPVCSPHARARILKRDASEAKKMRGIRSILMAEDIPGINDVGAVRPDEVLFAHDEVSYHGQIIALVVGETQENCRSAAAKVLMEYEPLQPILTIEEAIEANSYLTEPNYIRRGDVDTALETAQRRLEGEFAYGGQDHFYLETHAAWAEPGEDGTVRVVSSTQHPSEVQHLVAHVLNLSSHEVTVECVRMGGGFGGKETQPAIPASLAALAATKTGRRVRVRFNRDQDMIITGKRHPFLSRFAVGFNSEGKVLAAKVDLIANGGWSLDLTTAVTDRALCHLDNAYYLPNVLFSGRAAKTNVASNTAFRGFGGPQGMIVIEEIMDRIARSLGLDPETVRGRNLYHGTGETNSTHYGQQIENNRIQRIWGELLESSEFAMRRRQVAVWNSRHPHRKRGIAITPVKFGISFNLTHLNQAGAFVLIFKDGSVQVNHGGLEMGQGIHTNIATIAARELGVTRDRIRVMATSTDKVPNTSATAASSGTDLNGGAVRNACRELIGRLRPVAAKLLSEKGGDPVSPEAILFGNGRVSHRSGDAIITEVEFTDLTKRAYLEQVSLSATGFYRTPGIHWDRIKGRGKPFHYFAVGASVSEVEVDGRTGMMRFLRADILHDVGKPLNAGVMRGQVEGAFVQGVGWLTSEELLWSDKGHLLTHSPDTYKIPAVGDIPADFRVAFLSDAAQENNIYGTKAVGEPPLMLAFSVREAIRDAVAAFGRQGELVQLDSPATGEAIYNAIKRRG
jgi:xanthine dehydrogenase molybdopterin binding subunit/xanthine dehydrogenase small subunit